MRLKEYAEPIAQKQHKRTPIRLERMLFNKEHFKTDVVVEGFILEESEVIAQGARGKITRALVEFVYEQNGEEQTHREHMIIKRYSGRNHIANAEHAYRNYSIALNAGLTVLPVCLLEKNTGALFMEDYAENGKYMVSSAYGENDDASVSVNGALVERVFAIENIDSLVQKMLQEAQSAAEKGIKLYPDQFLFRFKVPQSKPAIVECALIDSDVLGSVEPKNPTVIKGVFEDNKQAIRKVLIDWIDRYVTTTNKGAYKNMVSTYIPLLM